MTTDASWLESMPELYDSCLGPALFSPFADHAAGIARSWSPQQVLEVAAGTGIGTAALCAALPGAQVTATDLNAAMVEWAAPRVPGARWRTADAQALDFADGSFDLVVCLFGAMFFPDKPLAFGQMRRVLKPGGHVLLTIWDTVDGSDLTAALVDCLADLFPDDSPTFVLRTPHGYTDPDRITTDLTAGGLTDVSIERVVLRGGPTVASTFTRGICLGSPLRFELQQHGDVDALTAQLGTLMTERLGADPVVGQLTAYVVTACHPG